MGVPQPVPQPYGSQPCTDGAAHALRILMIVYKFKLAILKTFDIFSYSFKNFILMVAENEKNFVKLRRKGSTDHVFDHVTFLYFYQLFGCTKPF